MSAAQIPIIPIEICEYHQLSLLEKELIERRGKASDNNEKWERYHESLCKAARKSGKVGDDPEAAIEFYHGGDWFHELADSFAIRGPRAVSAKCFRRLQAVVAAHDPNACVTLTGEIFTPLDGFEVIITATGIYVGWQEHSVQACRKELNELGFDLESDEEKRWWEFWK